MNTRLQPLVSRTIGWTKRNATELARVALGVTFIGSGATGSFGLSPAGDLVATTVNAGLTASWLSPLLGWSEALIGLCFIDPLRAFGINTRGWVTRFGLLVMATQILAMFLPVVVLPQALLAHSELSLVVDGPFIAKNIGLGGMATLLSVLLNHHSSRLVRTCLTSEVTPACLRPVADRAVAVHDRAVAVRDRAMAIRDRAVAVRDGALTDPGQALSAALAVRSAVRRTGGNAEAARPYPIEKAARVADHLRV